MKKTSKNLSIAGIPKNISETKAAVFRSKLLKIVYDSIDDNDLNPEDISITIHDNTSKVSSSNNNNTSNEDLSVEQRAKKYKSKKPRFTLNHLIISDEVKENIQSAIDVINEKIKHKAFVEWNLQAIEPSPRTVLNFYGPPGTGKTLAAQAIADKLDKPIIAASYADIESKYLGDGSKNIEAIFYAAERDGAVLFIDEADSLLSKRLSNATQGSERAANSMSSQLLICLEKFKGVVIFATNLVESYDKAFETRVRHIHFPMPDENQRELIWEKLAVILPDLPVASDLSIKELASIDDVCGRDIKNAIVDAAIRAAGNGNSVIQTQDFLEAINRIKENRIPSESAEQELEPEEKAEIEEKLKKATQNKSTDS